MKRAYREGKLDKANAVKQASSKKKRDTLIAKDAKRLLYKILADQWVLLLIGAPFMFCGSIIEFLVPNYIGKILNEFRANNWDGEDGVYPVLTEWCIWLAISAVCTFIRDFIFGVTSQRIGSAIRLKLYDSLIKKDISFFDNFKIGDLLSRLGSDTQVVQDGLSSNVAMFIKSAAVWVGTIVILFTYDWRLALIILAVVIPQIMV